METLNAVEVQLQAFLISGLNGCQWSASRPGRFAPERKRFDIHWIKGWVDTVLCVFHQKKKKTGNAKIRSILKVSLQPYPFFNKMMISSTSADFAFQSRQAFCYKRIGIWCSAKTSIHFTWPHRLQ